MECPDSTATNPTLAGKRILIVGVNDDEWADRGTAHVKRAKELGVEVVFLGSAKAGAAAHASTVIAVDSSDDEACHEAVAHLLATSRIDGITTFIEERSETAARLQRDFGFPGHGVLGTAAARDKNATREILRKNGLPVPCFVHLDDRRQAEDAASWFPVPAFFKPAHGAGSIATRRVATRDEIPAAFDEVLREIQTRIPPELVESLMGEVRETDANLLLEEYLAPAKRLDARGLGRVGIELLVQDGEIVFFAMADGRCCSPSDFRYATLSFPSRLGEDDERQLRAFAAAVVSVFELSNGPVILDAVMTDDGPQLYEINARIDSASVLPLIETCYGVDVVEQSLRIAAGLPVDLGSYEHAEASALLHFFLASSASKIEGLDLPHTLPFADDCVAQPLKREGDIVLGPEGTYDAIATVMLTGAGRDEVDARLAHYLASAKIELGALPARR